MDLCLSNTILDISIHDVSSQTFKDITNFKNCSYIMMTFILSNRVRAVTFVIRLLIRLRTWSLYVVLVVVGPILNFHFWPIFLSTRLKGLVYLWTWVIGPSFLVRSLIQVFLHFSLHSFCFVSNISFLWLFSLSSLFFLSLLWSVS